MSCCASPDTQSVGSYIRRYACSKLFLACGCLQKPEIATHWLSTHAPTGVSNWHHASVRLIVGRAPLLSTMRGVPCLPSGRRRGQQLIWPGCERRDLLVTRYRCHDASALLLSILIDWTNPSIPCVWAGCARACWNDEFRAAVLDLMDEMRLVDKEAVNLEI